MRVPIAHALAYPERIDSGAQPLDLASIKTLSFERPDPSRFPCLQLAYAALRAGGTAPAVLNAANEVAVAAFLARQLSFTGIHQLIQRTLERVPARAADDLDTILAADAEARRVAGAQIAGMAEGGKNRKMGSIVPIP
jgi:1-deoxy-D-xylulose-5-phosphate reductoisomerase